MLSTDQFPYDIGATWLSNFLVAELTPVGFDNIGYRYFIIYACINLFLIFPSKHILHIPHVVNRRYMPKSKGKARN